LTMGNIFSKGYLGPCTARSTHSTVTPTATTTYLMDCNDYCQCFESRKVNVGSQGFVLQRQRENSFRSCGVGTSTRLCVGARRSTAGSMFFGRLEAGKTKGGAVSLQRPPNPSTVDSLPLRCSAVGRYISLRKGHTLRRK
jgi:hypothetical protein